MRYEKIAIGEATLHAYLCDISLNNRKKDGLLIIPGGGYGFVSMDREGEPVAMEFTARGYSCFILQYSVKEKAKFPTPLQEAAMAMAYIKKNAETYRLDPERVFAMGFSAGGHLTACLGSLYGSEDVLSLEGVTEELARPKGTVLIYPVISGVNRPHLGSFQRLLGTETPTMEELEKYSVEKIVTEKTVPAFVLHTVADKTVPVRNSFVMAEALVEAGVPVELHILPQGRHGLALADERTARNPEEVIPAMAKWPELAHNWMKELK